MPGQTSKKKYSYYSKKVGKIIVLLKIKIVHFPNAGWLQII